MFNLKKMKAALKRASRNGFLIGVGSVLNIYPVYSAKSHTNFEHPDLSKLKSDWSAIGKDFNSVLKKSKK